MTLLMAFTNGIILMMNFDALLDATRATLFPSTLSALNLPIKSHLSSG